MNDDSTHPADLLPWFVNNTLSEHERLVVESHLETCPQCQQEVLLLQRMREQVKELPVESPGNVGLNRLLHEIRNEKELKQLPIRSWSKKWRTSLAIAASLIICIQTMLLMDAWYLSKPMVPQSATQQSSHVLQISFTPTATEAEIRESIHAIKGTFIDGPSALGIYRIRLHPPMTSKQNLERIIGQLRQQTSIIRHVALD